MFLNLVVDTMMIITIIFFKLYIHMSYTLFFLPEIQFSIKETLKKRTRISVTVEHSRVLPDSIA